MIFKEAKKGSKKTRKRLAKKGKRLQKKASLKRFKQRFRKRLKKRQSQMAQKGSKKVRKKGSQKKVTKNQESFKKGSKTKKVQFFLQKKTDKKLKRGLGLLSNFNEIISPRSHGSKKTLHDFSTGQNETVAADRGDEKTYGKKKRKTSNSEKQEKNVEKSAKK